jgi:carbon storage regulator
MDIFTLPFEKEIIIRIKDQDIKLITFRTPEHGNIKFGIDAPRSVKVNREEVYLNLLEEEKNKDK